jgi:hypothetical protein
MAPHTASGAVTLADDLTARAIPRAWLAIVADYGDGSVD